jgi:hypothetical protein
LFKQGLPDCRIGLIPGRHILRYGRSGIAVIHEFPSGPPKPIIAKPITAKPIIGISTWATFYFARHRFITMKCKSSPRTPRPLRIVP